MRGCIIVAMVLAGVAVPIFAFIVRELLHLSIGLQYIDGAAHKPMTQSHKAWLFVADALPAIGIVAGISLIGFAIFIFVKTPTVDAEVSPSENEMDASSEKHFV